MQDPDVEFVVESASLGASVVSLAAAVLQAVFSLLTSLPMLLLIIFVALGMFLWVPYHSVVIEEGEHFYRGVLFPFYRDVIRPIAQIIRDILNPLSCWLWGGNWLGFGLIQDAIYPTIKQCGVGPFFTNLGRFLAAVSKELLADYLFSGRFFNGPGQFTEMCDTWIAFWNSWMDLYGCSCSDLSIFLRSLPIVPSLFFSEQWADMDTWCAITNIINAAGELLGILLTLIIELIQLLLGLISPSSPYAGTTITRPNFYMVAEFLCRAGRCLGASTERALQRFWDAYIPFKWVFEGYLRIFDGFGCFVLKTANWVLTFLIHVDEIVQYPGNPFWATGMLPLTIENMNLVGPPTNFTTVLVPMAPAPTRYVIKNYYLDTANPLTPEGRPNPVYGRERLTTSACTFLDRTVCDPSNPDTACYTPDAAYLLRAVNFCCLTDSVTVLALDFTSAFVELTYHFTSGWDNFFLFFDNQPYTTLWTPDLANIAECIFSLFTLVPRVGFAIRNLLRELVRFAAGLIDFVFRLGVGLTSLPYFLLAMPGVDEFLTKTDRGINQWVGTIERFIEDTPDSFLNSACIILNYGFPIPPIPCATCEPGGFVPLPEGQMKRRRFYDPETQTTLSPWEIAAEALGWSNPDSAYLVTPLIYYHNASSFHPWDLARGIRVGVEDMAKRNIPLPFVAHADVDRFFDDKKRVMTDRWARIKTCQELKVEEEFHKRHQPHLWNYNRQRGKYDCDPDKITQEQLAKRRELIKDPDWNSGRGSCPAAAGVGFSNGNRKTQEWILDEVHRVPGHNESSFSSFGEGRQDSRLVLGPTIPPIATCENPIPPCFDMCCVGRAALKSGGFFLQALGRFVNGFIQFERHRWNSNTDFPYFTGEFCEPHFNRDCFESDLVTFNLLFFSNFKCLCNFVNLVIPITPGNPREDLCCGFQRVAEFIACLIQVIINFIKGLANGAGNDYMYFRENLFYNDISALFDIIIEVIACLCVFVRGVFPGNFIPGFTESVRYDPCCIPQATANFLAELGRFVTLTVISLATISISPDSFCYFRLDTTSGCSGTLDEIGIVKRYDAMVRSLLPLSDSGQPGSCKDYCGGRDQAHGGIVPCICQILNAIIPWRDDPTRPASCVPGDLNCPIVDFCCFFVRLGLASETLSVALSRFVVSLWQPWNPLPEFTIHYVFCDEEAGQVACGVANNQCAFTGVMSETPNCQCGTFTCGKILPFINALTNPNDGLIAECLCQLVGLLDDLLAMVFESVGGSWGGCFCGQPNGTLRTGPFVLNRILIAITGFLRKFPLPCYWNPAGITYTAVNGVPMPCEPQVDPGCTCVFEKRPMTNVNESFVYSVLGPTVEAICISIGNIWCFINSLFFIPADCYDIGRKFLGSTFRWSVEIVFRIAAAIEGFIQQFTEPMPSCVGSNPYCDVGSTGSYMGVGAAPFGRILTSLFSWVVDSLIGDGRVACSRICPKGIAAMQTCSCWQLSPQTGAYTINGDPVWARINNGTDILGNPQYACQIVANPATGNVGAVLGFNGVNDVTGIGATAPICEALFDFVSGDDRWPGSCANYFLCRPDSLPSCSVPEDADPATVAFNIPGPIDGTIMGFLRVIGCTGGQITRDIVHPFLIIFSIIWQLYGAVMYFIASIIVFIFSIFNLGGGCLCWEYSDPLQGGRTIHFAQGDPGTAAVGFCYRCPDAYAMCGPEPPLPWVCEPHCPFFQPSSNVSSAAAIAECVAALNVDHNPALWPAGSTAQTLCDGSYQEALIPTICGTGFLPNNPTYANCRRLFIQGWLNAPYTQVSCPQITCSAKVYPISDSFFQPEGFLLYDGMIPRISSTGSTIPDDPFVLCSFLQLIDNFIELLNTFVAIFTTPIIIPDARSDENFSPQNGGEKFSPTRENRTEFYRRTGYSKNFDDRVEKIPGILAIRNETLREEAKKEFQKLVEKSVSKSDRNDPNKHLKAFMHFQHRYLLSPPVTTAGSDNSIPSAPELIALALWDFDMSDCFTDPVACVCRNFHLPTHCAWTEELGIIPFAPAAKRKYGARSIGKEEEKEKRMMPEGSYNSLNTGEHFMHPDEAMAMMLDIFSSTTACDHTVITCGTSGETWSLMSHESMEMWSSCLEKRVQGERLNLVTHGITESDFFYRSQAPLAAFRNIVNSWQTASAKRQRIQHERSMRKRSKRDEMFPNLDQQLAERERKGRAYLKKEFDITYDSPMREAIVKADTLWMKWKLGYYHFLFDQAWATFQSGDWHFPTTEESLREVRLAAATLRHTLVNQPYKEIWSSSGVAVGHVTRWVNEVKEIGFAEYGRTLKRYWDEHLEERKRLNAPRRERAERIWYNTPLYKWWALPEWEDKGFLAPFLRHLQNIIGSYRAHYASGEFTLWSLDLHAKHALRAWVEPLSRPQWTYEQQQNWKRLSRMYHRVYDIIYPGQLDAKSLEIAREEPAGCIIVDRVIDTTLKVINFCAYEWVVNKRIDPDSLLGRYLEGVARNKGYCKADENELYIWSEANNQTNNWARLQMRAELNFTSTVKQSIRSRVDRHVYKRATMYVGTGPAGFNLIKWMEGLIEDLVNYMFSANLVTWIDTARAWITNPNTDEADYPNVGLKYWIFFHLRCEFPDNLNCSKGVGLEAALLWVTVGVVAAVILGSLILPPLMWLFELIAAPFVWIILVMNVGYHWSPRCFFLWPSILPIPIALPFCLQDDILALLDKIIRACPVGYIIPECLVLGPTCPSDPDTYVNIVSCVQVGVSDGLQNILFLGYKVFGSWFTNLANTIGGLVSFVLPGASPYLADTFASFANAGSVMECRQWWCFGLTLPALVIPGVVLFIFGIFAAVIIPWAISFLLQAYYWGASSPFYRDEGNDPYEDVEEDEIEVVQSPEASAPPAVDIDAFEDYVRNAQRGVGEV